MSTNKTEHYGLHSWTPEDDFLRAEMNENFQKLDQVMGSKGTVVLGRFTGNDKYSRRIELGAPIKFLVLDNTKGERQYHGTSVTTGAFLMPGFPLSDGAAAIDGEALVVQPFGSSRINSSAYTFLYLAILDKPE